VTVNGRLVEKAGSHEASFQPGRNVLSFVVKTADGGTGTYELTLDRGGNPASWR